MEPKYNPFEEFNNFQTAFYTSIERFNDFSLFEIKKHGYVLMNNLAKGFPHLSDLIANLKGLNWRGTESKAVLQALQHVKFINNFNRIVIPKFIYFKSNPAKKDDKKTKVKTVEIEGKKVNEFSEDVVNIIKSILMMDQKTYDYLKYSERVQYCGNQLIGDFQQIEKLKTSRKKKQIDL